MRQRKRSGAPGASAAGLRVESMGLSFSTGLGIHGHLTCGAPRLLLTLFILLAACGDRNVNWTLYDVKGHLPDLKFSLPGAGGKTVSSDDLKGKTVLLFFGYASCPDICPTTMAQLTAVLQNLGDKARDVRIVFVSVDPHRDTPDILQAYVDAFNKNAMGVTGDESRSPTWRAATASPTRSKSPSPATTPRSTM